MTSANLSPDSVARLLRIVGRHRAWYEALTGRICQRHWPHGDPVKAAAESVLSAVMNLERELRRVSQAK